MKQAITLEDIKIALQHPLPGWEAQKKVFPENRLNVNREKLIQPDHRESSVLLLIYPKQTGQLHLVLIRRPEYEGVHSGQIALPGGRREDGETLEMTALRETYEEVGVSSENIKMLGQLSRTYIPPSNFMVYPFVAYSPSQPLFIPCEDEVEEIIEVPLTLLLDKNNLCSEMRDFPFGKFEIGYYKVFEHKVWGATAMILSEFIAILRDRA